MTNTIIKTIAFGALVIFLPVAPTLNPDILTALQYVLGWVKGFITIFPFLQPLLTIALLIGGIKITWSTFLIVNWLHNKLV